MLRTPKFKKIDLVNQYDVKRSRFDAGIKLPAQKQIPSALKPRRIGKLDMDGLRPNFDAPNIKPRLPTDFNKLQEQEDALFGKTVRLSGETLKKLFEVEIPDSTDVAWIAERNRLDALGQRQVLPFGREQRKIKKQVNLGEAAEKAVDKTELKAQFAQLQAAVQQGLLENRRGRATIGANIAQLILANNDLNTLTRNELRQLMDQTTQLTIPKDYRRAGFTHRLYSSEQIKAQKAEIVLFLLANLGKNPGIDPKVPIPQIVEKKFLGGEFESGNPVDISHLFTKMDTPEIPRSFPTTLLGKFAGFVPPRNSKFLDLRHFRIIPLSGALQMAMKGADNRILNGVKVLPPPPADEKTEQVKTFISLKLWNSVQYKKELKRSTLDDVNGLAIDWNKKDGKIEKLAPGLFTPRMALGVPPAAPRAPLATLPPAA